MMLQVNRVVNPKNCYVSEYLFNLSINFAIFYIATKRTLYFAVFPKFQLPNLKQIKNSTNLSHFYLRQFVFVLFRFAYNLNGLTRKSFQTSSIGEDRLLVSLLVRVCFKILVLDTGKSISCRCAVVNLVDLLYIPFVKQPET